MRRNRERYSIHIYDPSQALSRLKAANIPVYNFRKVEEYVYEFETLPRSEKKIKAIFEDAILIKKLGPYSILYNLWHRKTALVALIISSLCFFSLSSRIYDININGNSRILTARIAQQLDKLGITKYTHKPSYEKLLEYEKRLKDIFYEDIEFLEVRLIGVNLKVNYTKRRDSVTLPSKTTAKYATKKGIIDHFVVSSGEIMVKENQYVQEGTLLINDRLLTPNGEEIIVGAEGEVYAWTWTVVDLTMKVTSQNEESEIMSSMLDEAEMLVASGFYKEERIEKAIILSFQIADNIASMKVHFTCLEDIAN